LSGFDRIRYNHTNMEKTFMVLESILEALPPQQKSVMLNAKIYGRMVKKWPMTSKNTLVQQEIKVYTMDLMNIYKQWGSRPQFSSLHNWSIKEGEGYRFTIMLKRMEK